MSDKLTIEELDNKFRMLSLNLNTLFRRLDSLGYAFSKYTEFMENSDKFKNYLENLQKINKLKENDGKTEKSKV